jgi:hypothetical protein
VLKLPPFPFSKSKRGAWSCFCFWVFGIGFMNVDYDDFVIVDMFSVKLGMICVCWLGIHGFLFNPCISFYEK